MQEIDFSQMLDKIVAFDPRYQRDGYLFVREALDYTQKKVVKNQKRARHVSGKELLEGIQEYSLSQFGPMALTVLETWGITRCEDFGEIVFNMVEAGILSKTPTDSRDDFKNGYDFVHAFRDPFLPRSKKQHPPVDTPRS